MKRTLTKSPAQTVLDSPDFARKVTQAVRIARAIEALRELGLEAEAVAVEAQHETLAFYRMRFEGRAA